MKSILPILFSMFITASYAQKVSMTSEKTIIDEPYNPNDPQNGSTTVKVTIGVVGFDSSITCKVSVDKERSRYKGDVTINDKSELSVTVGNGSSDYQLKVKTSPYSWANEDIVLKLSWSAENTKAEGEVTLNINVINKYPVLGVASKNQSAWDEMREAEVFIGTNFDFIDRNVKTTDWYGGVRLFLPQVTRVSFKSSKAKRLNVERRVGAFAGLYNSKSFSRNSYPSIPGSPTGRTYVFERIVGDVYNTPGEREFTIERDSVEFSGQNSIRNFGLYGGITYLISEPKEVNDNSIFQFYIGAHFEVIRRNVGSENLVFDTIRRAFNTRTVRTRGGVARIDDYPVLSSVIYTDSYFGVTFPMQYRWKDMLHLRVSPTFGYSSYQFPLDGDRTGKIDNVNSDEIIVPTTRFGSSFYLFPFDLLVRMGGLSINLGGEVRGIFRGGSPIATAHVGTSFAINKLIDFVKGD